LDGFALGDAVDDIFRFLDPRIVGECVTLSQPYRECIKYPISLGRAIAK
jgi:hypothetical protein